MLDGNNRIINFSEKNNSSISKSGLINGGVYFLDNSIIFQDDKFSFEKDFLEGSYKKNNFYGYEFKDYFIDIGIPKDYKNFIKIINDC